MKIFNKIKCKKSDTEYALFLKTWESKQQDGVEGGSQTYQNLFPFYNK